MVRAVQSEPVSMTDMTKIPDKHCYRTALGFSFSGVDEIGDDHARSCRVAGTPADKPYRTAFTLQAFNFSPE